MVNEYGNTGGSIASGTKMTTDEYIEFILTENMTPAQLAALTFGDSNATTSSLEGVFSFNLATLNSVLTTTGRTHFLAGTLLVVKGAGLGAQNLTYDPLLSNVGNDDLWSIELTAGQGALDHPETVINGNIDIAGAGDLVWISTNNPPSSATDYTGFIHAIGHDNSPGSAATAVTNQFGANHITSVSSLSSGRSIYNSANQVVLLVNDVGSLGRTNGGTNTTWIDGLRNAAVVPEPSRGLLMLFGILGLSIRRRHRWC
jgi:hypothetical protein